MSKFIIYGLIDPRTGQIRYIGKSSSGLSRPSEGHYHGRCKNWISNLKEAGLRYQIKVMEDVGSKDMLNAAERNWIAHGRSEGWPLTNLTNGGDGGGSPWSDETRAKMTRVFRQRGTAEYRAKISQALQGHSVSPATREKLREAQLGRVANIETRTKQSIALRGRILSVEHRARLSAARMGIVYSKNTKRRMRIGQMIRFATARTMPRMRLNLLGGQGKR